MKILVSFLMLIFPLMMQAQGYQLDWAKIHQPQSSSGGDSQGEVIAVDDSGYIYIAGTFSGTVDFDMNAGVSNLTSSTYGSDIYIQKLDSLGNLVWVKGLIGSGDLCFVTSLAIDISGGVYVGGRFEGTVDFDPGAGVDQKTSQGNSRPDGYIVKLNTNGDYEWSVALVSQPNPLVLGSDNILDIEIDKQGNVLIIGHFEGTIDLDPGPSSNNLITQTQGSYLLRLSSQGNFIWARGYRMTGQYDYAMNGAMDISEHGDILVAGSFAGGVDFDPGPDSTFLSGMGTYLTRFDSLGNFISVKKLSEGRSTVNNIALDHQGGIFISGHFNNDTVDFDIGPGTNLLPFNLYPPYNYIDFYLAKFDTSGQLKWVTANGSRGFDIINSMVIDSLGNILASGTFGEGAFGNTLDFDPGPKQFNLTGISGDNVFRVKYDTYGNFIAGTILKSSISITAGEMAIDKRGYLYATGAFRGTVDFDPTSAVFNLGNSNFGQRTFLQKLGPCNISYGNDSITACGSFTWIDSVTYTTSNESASHLLTSSGGCDSLVYLYLDINDSPLTIDSISACGSYTWIDSVTYTFSNYTSSVTLTNSKGCDSIVHLALTIGDNTGIDSYNLCDSTLTWIDGITYSTSNYSATHTLTNSKGCDSIVSLDLTINQSKVFNDVITACDSFTWVDGITYISNNNSAIHYLTTAAGCDSIVSLDLTINQTTFGIDSVVACDSYTWIDGITYTRDNFNPLPRHTLTNTAGCDSVVSLSLKLKKTRYGLETVKACKSYTWIDGITYFKDTMALDTVVSSIGCDSIVSLDLEVSHVDTSVSYNGIALQANSPNATYQWIDCLDGFAGISGANGQSFIPSKNGQYAVIINDGGCVDTSACLTINNVSLDDISPFNRISVSPNPSNGKLVIKGETFVNNDIIKFELVNSQGTIVHKSEATLVKNSFNHTIWLENISTGMYFIKITLKGSTITKVVLLGHK